MSARALEFVETWVSEKIEAMETLPAEGNEAATKALANECFQVALDEDIPAAEIQEAFDDLAEFIAGEIEEERDRREETEDDDEAPDEEDEDEK
jgi:chromatin remodeling complex protein RSC6